MYTCYIQSFKILAEQDGLNRTRSKIFEDTFSRDVAQLLHEFIAQKISLCNQSVILT